MSGPSIPLVLEMIDNQLIPWKFFFAAFVPYLAAVVYAAFISHRNFKGEVALSIFAAGSIFTCWYLLTTFSFSFAQFLFAQLALEGPVTLVTVAVISQIKPKPLSKEEDPFQIV